MNFELVVSQITLLWLQIGGEAGVSNPQMDKMKNIMRIMAVAMIPVSATFPSVSILVTQWIM